MNPVKPNLKTEWFSWLLIIVSVGLAFYFQANLPGSVPSHWNFAGEIDGYSSRTFGAWFGPILLAGMYLLFLALPFIDPKRDRYLEFRKQYHALKTVLLSFIFLIYVLAASAGLGYTIDFARLMPLLIGALFVIIGYYLKFIKRNWLIGIRTPWTIESETVWNKTNKLASKLFMVGGVLMALSSFIMIDWLKLGILIAILISLLLGTLVYSYWLYQEEKKVKK